MAFTVSLPELYRSIDVAWSDAIWRTQFQAQADSVKTLLQNQTARVQPGELVSGSNQNAKKRTVKVYWQNTCAITTGAETDECVVATTELTDSSEDYAITNSREASFKTSWKVHRTVPHEFNETIAKGLLKAGKELDEYLSAQFLAFLAANNGAFENTPSVGAASGGADANVWEINATDWNVDLMMEFALAARHARFDAPYMLHGENLWRERFKAGQYAANDDGRGENNLFGVLPMFWDPIGFGAASVQTESFLVNRSSCALATVNYFDTAPSEFAGNHRMYKIASRNLPGVMYDVHEMETCTSDDMVVSYKVLANYEFLLNPLGCAADRTGILQFSKVAGV